jgi:hypothetical protein
MFKKLDFRLQADRDKMIWTDRDLALVACVALVVGYFIGLVS